VKNLGLWIFGAYIAWLVVTNRLLPMLSLAWTQGQGISPHTGSANAAAQSLGGSANGTLSNIFQGANILSTATGLWGSPLVQNPNAQNAVNVSNQQLNMLGLPNAGSNNTPFTNLLGFGLYELQNSGGVNSAGQSQNFTTLGTP